MAYLNNYGDMLIGFSDVWLQLVGHFELKN